MKVDATLEDCKLDKAVIVTKRGFTEDATTYADHRNVQLVKNPDQEMINKMVDVAQARSAKVQDDEGGL